MLEICLMDRPEWATQISHDIWHKPLRDFDSSRQHYETAHICDMWWYQLKSKYKKVKDSMHRRKRVYYKELSVFE